MSICDTKEQFIEIFKKKYDKEYQHSLFGKSPSNKESKKQVAPKELSRIVKTVVSHKIDPSKPLPNNTFKKS
jgi:hypothetical protein